MKTYQKIILLGVLIFCEAVFVMGNLGEIKGGTKKALKAMNLYTVCDETLYYSLGSVDERFGISQEEIREVLFQAENIWEKDLSRNVLEYREGAEFKINFIFDERQQQTIEKNNLDSKLEQLSEVQENISQKYAALEAEYKKALGSYERNVANYEKRVNDFNAEVEKWNEKGGAPEDKYEDLRNEEEDLEKLKDKLEGERKRVNAMVVNLNELAKKESGSVEKYNKEVQTYREKFGEANEFNQGEYNGVGINIYQFYEEADLKLVLAHEFGHALGVDHVENPQSIMYYLMEKQDLENTKLTLEDLGAIKGICKIEI